VNCLGKLWSSKWELLPWLLDADRYVNRLPAHERCVERTERAPSEEEKPRRRQSALLGHLSPSFPIGHGRGVGGVGLGNRDFSVRALLRGYMLLRSKRLVFAMSLTGFVYLYAVY